MKKVIGVAALVFGMASGMAVAKDGPNPCRWEHDPQPAYCKVKRDVKKNNVVPVKREHAAKRRMGGDR
ncbi:hypothetical protein GZ77_09865 [Endozoicomonas montiporae]|uniref:Uncharacterized protein n=2 Tax=Endozoicomonas montiporae TaxID=1027273 RepID=A0A081N843_9GAMM|nr:hypothetical protein [Endozoicomonas montiporae]AMO55498.1 hypothetical protein EZMO1_1307 [Endozoicomonas montiporae CL-33]KEQ14616.1 hypothetical protein GZ77_09865 [Endozoicomonas montiporae]